MFWKKLDLRIQISFFFFFEKKIRSENANQFCFEKKPDLKIQINFVLKKSNMKIQISFVFKKNQIWEIWLVLFWKKIKSENLGQFYLYKKKKKNQIWNFRSVLFKKKKSDLKIQIRFVLVVITNFEVKEKQLK